MATTRITVTLSTEQVDELKKLTDNVSGYVAEAVARQIRHQLLGADLTRYQEEQGTFTEEELDAARAKLRQPGPVAILTSDVDDMTGLRGGRVRLIDV